MIPPRPARVPWPDGIHPALLILTRCAPARRELYGSCKESVKFRNPGSLQQSPHVERDMDPLESNPKQRRFLVIAIVVVVGALIGLFFLRRGGDPGGEKYRTEAVSQGDVSAAVSATGTLSAVTTVQVGSQ